VQGEISLLPCAVSCSFWGSNPTSVQSLGQTRTRLSKDTIEATERSAYSGIGLQRVPQVREVTDTFLQHYNWERPHQGRTCHHVPPRVAFPNLPTLAALPERVDPDRWLVTLDHQLFLRRVGRDGCQSARPASLLHPSATGRGPDPHAGWKPKTPSLWSGMPIRSSRSCRRSGLVRQEMAIDEYLKYIRAEALAYERRFSTRSGGEGLASTRTLVAGRVPASASSLLIRLCRGTSGGRIFVFTRGKQAYQQTSRSSLIRETAICTLLLFFHYLLFPYPTSAVSMSLTPTG
jgi:hypothetical protein